MTQPTLSASQLETFKLCPRRWFLKYIEKLEDPQGDSAAAGSAVHTLLERYLKDGIYPDPAATWQARPDAFVYEIGKIALAMIENLPPAGSVPDVEITLKLEADGIKYQGRVDARRREDTIVVTDHKSTSSLRNAKSEDDLREDIQAILYAKWASEDVTLEWNYGQSKIKEETRKAPAHFPTRVVRLKLTKEEADQKFETIVQPLARKVLAAYASRDKKSCRQNTDSCHMFPPKGCPYKSVCIDKVVTGGKMNLLEKIKNKNSVVEPERAAIVAEHVAKIAEMQERQLDPINSPEGQLRAQTQLPATEPIVVDTLPKKPRKKREPMTLEERQAVPASKTEEVAASLGIEPNDVIKLDAEDSKVFAESLVNVNGDTQGKSPAADTDKPIRTLFIGAIPLGKPVKFAHDLIAKAAQTVENDLELHHVLLAPYSTGGASLAAQLKNDILSSGESGFDLVLMNRTAEGRAIEATLCGLAENVVVGL